MNIPLSAVPIKETRDRSGWANFANLSMLSVPLLGHVPCYLDPDFISGQRKETLRGKTRGMPMPHFRNLIAILGIHDSNPDRFRPLDGRISTQRYVLTSRCTQKGNHSNGIIALDRN